MLGGTHPSRTREIRLNKGHVAIVDAADFDWLNRWCWHARPSSSGRTFYARTKIDGVSVLMHRLILGAPLGVEVDHRDRDGLHNWRHNIRLCSHGQNSANRITPPNASGYRGVHWEAEKRRFRAVIHTDRKRLRLGRFSTAEAAARAYDAAAVRHFGDFAVLNFPEELAA